MRDAGWLVYQVPEAEIYHFGGGSTRRVSLRARAESWRSRYLYFKKSLGLGPAGMMLLYAAGFLQVLYHFTGHGLMNLLTLFTFRRLRNRLRMFGYLLLWHVRGCPVSMCLPRATP
jgi:GT2 family glycosyltransferase